VTGTRSETYAYLAGALLAAVTMASAPTETFAYDGAGRATEVRSAAVTWDADDHVTTMGGHSWSFDAQGRRTRVDGVEHLVAPTLNESLESPWLVMDAGGAARVGYVYAGEHPLARYDATTGARVYYLTDAMGSVIALVGDSPTDRATIHYDGFGNVRRLGGNAGMAALPSEAGGDFKFQGMWSDAGTGMYYVRARVYDAQTGRFLSRDPAEGSREDPSAYLAYASVQGNPFVARDPSGQWTLVEISASLRVEAVQMTLAFGRWGAPFAAALRGAANVIDLLNRVVQSGYIQVSAARLSHVLERHFPGGSESAGKSEFYDGEEFLALLRASQSVLPRLQAFGGNFQRIVHAGRYIGMDRNNMYLPTQMYTVITDASGNLITMFPGVP
jgi:RHS repeat-associated protein